MNVHLVYARKHLLECLGLKETETICTKIKCNTKSLPEVVGQGRPRGRISCGHVHVYSDPKTKKAQNEIAERYIAARGTIRKSVKCPIVMCCVSHRKYPASKPKKNEGEQDVFKPDASNIVKIVEDALNGIAYHDDSQIVGEITLKAPRVGLDDWLEIEITYCEKL